MKTFNCLFAKTVVWAIFLGSCGQSFAVQEGESELPRQTKDDALVAMKLEYQKLAAVLEEVKGALGVSEASRKEIELARLELEKNYEKAESSRQRLEKDLNLAKENNARLETSLKFMKIGSRIANLAVLEKANDAEGKPLIKIKFTEVDKENNEIGGSREFTVHGNKIYLDGWAVSFDERYLEHAEEFTGASFFIFKSVYGEAEKPSEGQRLDVPTQENPIPGVYKDEVKRDFETKLWNGFWKAEDERHLQRELGFRASHAQAVLAQPKSGQTYRVELSSGRITITQIQEP